MKRESTIYRDGKRFRTEGAMTQIDRHSACHRKRRYTTQRIAEQAARDTNTATGLNLRAYECPYCEGHHLTSTPDCSLQRQIARLEQHLRELGHEC